jgi:hypothetical protein
MGIFIEPSWKKDRLTDYACTVYFVTDPVTGSNEAKRLVFDTDKEERRFARDHGQTVYRRTRTKREPAGARQ